VTKSARSVCPRADTFTVFLNTFTLKIQGALSDTGTRSFRPKKVRYNGFGRHRIRQNILKAILYGLRAYPINRVTGNFLVLYLVGK
jgi:hypothetical protein